MIATTTETTIPLPTLSPLKSVREKCRDCSGYVPSEVRDCSVRDCNLHLLRMGKKPGPGVSTLRAIRSKCLECCLGSASEVRRCHLVACALHSYRFGKNPSLAGKGRGNAAALARWREKKACGPYVGDATDRDGTIGPSEAVMA